MADTFPFELVSPQRLVVSEPVASVVVPGSEGEFEIMAGPAPFLATIRPGVLVVKPASGAPRKVFVRGGFADVSPTGLTVLAEEAVPVETLKPERILEAIKNAEEDLADATDSLTKAQAALTLNQLREVKAALGF